MKSRFSLTPRSVFLQEPDATSQPKGEGIGLLRIMAQHNISACTEVTYPESFLKIQSSKNSENYQHLRKNISYWTAQVWEDYCSFLLIEHDESMLEKYWSIK